MSKNTFVIKPLITLHLPLSISFVTMATAFSGYSQSTISLGIRNGFGVTPIAIHAVLDIEHNSQFVRSNASYTKGLLMQYLIGGRIGIETGIQRIQHSYFSENEKYSVKSFLGWNALIKEYDYQMPLLLLFKINHPNNPFKHFKLLAGTSLEWLTTEDFTQPEDVKWLRNIVCGIRVGSDKQYARLEYGLEYQYALSRFNLQSVTYSLPDAKLNSTINMVSINLYYFFLNEAL